MIHQDAFHPSLETPLESIAIDVPENPDEGFLNVVFCFLGIASIPAGDGVEIVNVFVVDMLES